jgi:hypothetical protein
MSSLSHMTMTRSSPRMVELEARPSFSCISDHRTTCRVIFRYAEALNPRNAFK